MLDSESKERILVGEVTTIVAQAGQYPREITVHDQGLDMEVEFRSDAGEATGRRVYLQLKSGDSHLRRRRDGSEVFPLKHERHARYWMAQPCPVMLVIRSSAGEIRWMEVRDWLKRKSAGGTKVVKQIVFTGKAFDATSVRRWREEALCLVPTGPSALANLPAARPRFGRDDLFTDLVTTLLADEPQPTPLLGYPGVGKSHLIICALHDPSIAAKYGARRYFVRCDGATTAEAALGEIAKTLGVPLGPDLFPQVRHHLAAGPVALALDNFETPWDKEELSAEGLLEQLLVAPTVALVISLRGKQAPLRPAWRSAIEVTPLPRPHARELFVQAAGGKHASDPHLDNLVESLAGLPVALELLGHSAQSEDDLASLWSRWQQRQTSLLRRGRGDDKETNAEISFEISIRGPRMTDPSRRLLFLLAKLPGGIAYADLEALLPGKGDQAAAILRAVGLAFNEGGRVRALAPLRAYVARDHPPRKKDWRRSLVHYYGLAGTLGPKVGAEGGAEAVARLSRETGNLEALIQSGLESAEPRDAIDAILGLTDFLGRTGLGDATLLEDAAESARRLRDLPRQAQALRKLAAIHLFRWDYTAASLACKKSLSFYQQIDDLWGQAKCLEISGDIHLVRLELADARSAYELALSFYHQVDVPGTLLGQANCMGRLGDIQLRRWNLDDAKYFYLQALKLYQQVGSLLGQTNCGRSLGDIHLRQGNLAAARHHYMDALPLYQRIGNPIGQGNCRLGLGEISLIEGNQPLACQYYQEALDCYTQVGAAYSTGQAHYYLACAVDNENERRWHVEHAREIWEKANLGNLVEFLDLALKDS